MLGVCFSGNLQALPPLHQSIVFIKFQARTFVLLFFYLFIFLNCCGSQSIEILVMDLGPWYPLKFWHFPLAMTFTLSGDLLVLEEFPAVNLQVNKIIVCSNSNKEMCTIRPGMIDNLAKMVSCGFFFPCPTKRLIIKFGHYNFRAVNRQCWQGYYIIFVVHLVFPGFCTLPAPLPNINQVWDFGNLTQAQ